MTALSEMVTTHGDEYTEPDSRYSKETVPMLPEVDKTMLFLTVNEPLELVVPMVVRISDAVPPEPTDDGLAFTSLLANITVPPAMVKLFKTLHKFIANSPPTALFALRMLPVSVKVLELKVRAPVEYRTLTCVLPVVLPNVMEMVLFVKLKSELPIKSIFGLMRM